MNTNALKKFAQETRRKLMQQIAAKLEFVTNNDTPELREKAEQVRKLKEELQKTTKEQLVDKVAYTWFNRFMALRFMDVNDFQPLGVRVISPLPGQTAPEILNLTKQGDIAPELKVNEQKVMDILDGRTSSSNPQNEAYKELLIASCNHLHTVLPFLFERINDFTELLLPDDLTSQFSILSDVVTGMTEEDCKEVEIIGWLYQFYISEWNDELISSKKVYKKNELAPASQLFTPKWIVQYMVDNTLGQLWSEMQPNTKITSDLAYYIKPAYKEQLKPRTKKSIEEIKFFEPCAGSGHILSYAFDVFYKIYEEEGYNPAEIPELIITNNLFGVDIDPRAAQLASFVLIMKGRQKNKRFLRSVETKHISPNLFFYQDFEFDNKFKNATALGSLIKVEPHELKSIKVDKNSLFGERQEEVLNLYKLLGQRYDVVVTNPPYISSSRMEGSLKQYVEATYPETKSDLFATFILRCLELCNEDGLTGYMTPFVWMFISSYEKLREIIIDKHFINNLIQLEYSGFDGATVPICTFTLRNKSISKAIGSYIRLSDFKGAQNQAPKTLEAIQNPNCGWFYLANQKDFKLISGNPIGYWASTKFIESFSSNKSLENYSNLAKGMDSGKNDMFIRLWYECKSQNSSYNIDDAKPTLHDIKWIPYRKGGEYRRWFGNNDFVINWSNNGKAVRNFSNSNIRNEKYYFKKGLSWTLLSSSFFGVRYYEKGGVFDANGSSLFTDSDEELYQILGLLSSKISIEALKIINPTLAFQKGNLEKIPVKKEIFINDISTQVKELISISKLDWDAKEVSWDFKRNELIRIKAQDLEESFDLFQQSWKNKFYQLHKGEEVLNRQFIGIYGLQDELVPEVPLEEITILKEETSIENGQLVFHEDGVIKQFVSYAVGCMFGRYSLDKEGLVLANQGETLEDYLKKIGASTPLINQFMPDADNIIPVLEEDWFEDDIVGRFNAFLKASFGEANFQKNLAFVEESLGKDVRKFFTKDFYTDHIQRYKKRPIYWMFSSPKGAFNVLVYMHRYTPDTLSNILNNYLREFIEKLKSRKEHLEQIKISGSAVEQSKAIKEIDKLDKMLLDCQDYEREILFNLATERIAIDLDDGVLVNYNKFGKAIKEVKGLNDATTKKKVKEFDWIDVSKIK
jgi:type II restriction/modification system DNA methylase subunit YeeA